MSQLFSENVSNKHVFHGGEERSISLCPNLVYIEDDTSLHLPYVHVIFAFLRIEPRDCHHCYNIIFISCKNGMVIWSIQWTYGFCIPLLSHPLSLAKAVSGFLCGASSWKRRMPSVCSREQSGQPSVHFQQKQQETRTVDNHEVWGGKHISQKKWCSA